MCNEWVSLTIFKLLQTEFSRRESCKMARQSLDENAIKSSMCMYAMLDQLILIWTLDYYILYVLWIVAIATGLCGAWVLIGCHDRAHAIDIELTCHLPSVELIESITYVWSYVSPKTNEKQERKKNVNSDTCWVRISIILRLESTASSYARTLCSAALTASHRTITLWYSQLYSQIKHSKYIQYELAYSQIKTAHSLL